MFKAIKCNVIENKQQQLEPQYAIEDPELEKAIFESLTLQNIENQRAVMRKKFEADLKKAIKMSEKIN